MSEDSGTSEQEEQYSVLIPNPPLIDWMSIFDGTYAQCQEYVRGAMKRYSQLVAEETARGVQGLLRASLRPPQMYISRRR